jgi:opacity protein-like surface antigen
MAHFLRPFSAVDSYFGRCYSGLRPEFTIFLMTKLHYIIAVLFVCLGITHAQAADTASESKYNPATARKLTKDEAKTFGPGAGKYRYDARMIRAAEIAAKRARAHSSKRCWRYVKYALLGADAVQSYPDTVYAKQAANELSTEYGFQKLAVRDPYRAPIGSVLVYGGRGAGHVEIRTKSGFVSDFSSAKPSERPFLGAYVLPKNKKS